MKKAVPTITVFVRHSKDCTYTGETTDRKTRCKCRKHLRYIHPVTGKFTREGTGADDWAGADRARKAKEQELEDLLFPRQQTESQITIVDAIENFVAAKEGRNVTKKVTVRDRADLMRMKTFCESQGAVLLRQITLPMLTQYRQTWANKGGHYRSTLTRAKVQIRIQGLFLYAMKAGWISQNPAALLGAIQTDRKPTLPLEPDEYLKVINAIPALYTGEEAQFIRAHVRLMRYSGLAAKDATLLRRDALQLHPEGKFYRVITSRAKTRKKKNAPVVYVPIPTDVAEELLALPALHGDHFFAERETVTVRNYWQYRYMKVFKKAGLWAGISDDGTCPMTSHRLRDTFAVEHLKAGVPLELVSKMLGHSSITTTERHYAPWVKSRQDRLDAVVSASLGGVALAEYRTTDAVPIASELCH